MPVYLVKCEDCKTITEMLVSYKQVDENNKVSETVCPSCGKEHLTKLPTLEGGVFHLKGPGWYKDGY